jgi:hypothetical protein
MHECIKATTLPEDALSNPYYSQLYFRAPHSPLTSLVN